MPQLSNTIPLPICVDANAPETKYSGISSIYHANTMTESVNNNEFSDIVLNCESLNTIKIERETDDDEAGIMPPATDMDLMSNCDTSNDVKNVAKIKPTTTFLCHRCSLVFSSRDTFEMHYK